MNTSNKDGEISHKTEEGLQSEKLPEEKPLNENTLKLKTD